MNILIVTHYFPPEIGAPQARLSELAKRFAETESVTVLTGMPNHPKGIIAKGYEKKIRLEEFVDNYKILRSWVYATPNEGFIKKTLGHISFMISSVLLNFFKLGPVDVVVVSSPTFFSIFSAYFIAKVKRARFVVEIRDLWPGIFVELGVLTNKQVIAVLSAIELFFYKTSDRVVVVTEGFKENIVKRNIPESKVFVIRNGADVSRFKPRERVAAMRELFKADTDQVVVLYAGAHGISHGLESVLKAAELLSEEKHIKFVFVGEGARKEALLSQAKNLNNVLMLPSVGRDEMPELVASADICLAPLKDVPLFSTFIPSKIFEYMAASKPVIGCLTGEPAKILQEGSQIVVPPEDPISLANAINMLAKDEEKREKLGSAGRDFVIKNFNREALADTYLEIIRKI